MDEVFSAADPFPASPRFSVSRRPASHFGPVAFLDLMGLFGCGARRLRNENASLRTENARLRAEVAKLTEQLTGVHGLEFAVLAKPSVASKEQQVATGTSFGARPSIADIERERRTSLGHLPILTRADQVIDGVLPLAAAFDKFDADASGGICLLYTSPSPRDS